MIGDKIAICFTCCGPTYRKTARKKLMKQYKDDPNIFYFILTDDKKYFKGVKRKNLVVNELKDFYEEYPLLEKYEWFLESSSVEDYAKKFVDIAYRFPFSTNRFHMKQAEKFDILNIVTLGTDTDVKLDRITPWLSNQDKLYNAVSIWIENTEKQHMNLIVDILESKYNKKVDKDIFVFDAAAKFFSFSTKEKMMEFFNIWNDIMFMLYEADKIKLFQGGYAVNDEYILAPIYNALGITRDEKFDQHMLFDVRHNQAEERFWA